MTRCSSCGAQIEWAVTERGAPMPVDAKPVPDGNILLSHRRGGEPPVAVYQRPDDIAKLRAQHAHRAPDTGEGPFGLFVSHFATCPQAARHRRPRDLPAARTPAAGEAAAAKHPTHRAPAAAREEQATTGSEGRDASC